jgi:predicted Zn-dependent protease with MMP-like domain
MMNVSSEEFEALVASALDGLPEPFASRLDNVQVIVADEPSAEELARANVQPGHTLFGLYQGVPQTQRNSNYTWVLPDKITIYRGPLLRASRDGEEVRRQVQTVVIHEIAHHFGISDERLDELGW